ncbi:MAG: hypothetical protein LUH51_08200 [Firmicutes bacterium]|nr:hypothetical protein [Bacillota bacterium]
MKINTYFPPYYAEFRCLAAACPASCCKDWEVEVDEASAARYRAEPGKLGDTLRAALRREDGSIWMTLKNGECPLLCAPTACAAFRPSLGSRRFARPVGNSRA